MLTRGIALIAAVFVLTVSSWASAQDACTTSFAAAQESRDAGKYVKARAELLQCAASTCPGAISAQCIAWLEELNKEQPSISVRVKRGDDDLTDAKILIDGKEVASSIDGKPILTDPGAQVVVVVVGAERVEKKVVLVAGEKARQIVFELEPAGAATPGPTPTPTPGPTPTPTPTPTPDPGGDTAGGGGIHPLVFIGYGIGLAGIIVGAVTGGLSLSKASDVETACPTKQCGPEVVDDIDSGELLAHVSTATFAIGAAGVVLGTIGLFLGGGGDEPAEAGDVAISVGPTSLMITGSF